MSKKSMITVGGIMIVMAIIILIIYQEVALDAEDAAWYSTTEEYYRLLRISILLKYFGIGVGIVGAILMLAGLIKTKAQNIEPVLNPSDFQFCPQCGAKNLGASKFCSKCGAQLL